MLNNDKIDVSKYICVNKTSASKDCIIYHCRYFQMNRLNFNQMSAMGVRFSALLIVVLLMELANVRLQFWQKKKKN